MVDDFTRECLAGCSTCQPIARAACILSFGTWRFVFGQAQVGSIFTGQTRGAFENGGGWFERGSGRARQSDDRRSGVRRRRPVFAPNEDP